MAAHWLTDKTPLAFGLAAGRSASWTASPGEMEIKFRRLHQLKKDRRLPA
jgi:hypothetical protein